MFYENFINLCNSRGEKPTPVLKHLNLSPGNLEKWRNGASVNSDVLQKIALYFNVSVDFLLEIEKKTTPEEQSLDEEKQKLIDWIMKAKPENIIRARDYFELLENQKNL